MLYALGIGLGHDPLDAGQLRYVYEQGLQAFPSQATVLGYPGFWMSDPRAGIDRVRLVHGEQRLAVHAPLPASGAVIGKRDRKSTRLNSQSLMRISYAVFCLKKKTNKQHNRTNCNTNIHTHTIL